MAHVCHATGCRVEVPREMFMCKRHWAALPGWMRAEVWRTYRPGQCDDWQISHEYAEAARNAVRWTARREGVGPDTSVYDVLDPARHEQEAHVPKVQASGKPRATRFSNHVRRWQDCRLCPLCEGRTKVVIHRGKVPCDVLFVGEAPGISEDVRGVPFDGPAGQLLDAIVARAVKLSEVEGLRFGFTNLIACLPLDEGGGKNAKPPAKSIQACKPRLEELIRISDPSLIVAVGQDASTWLEPPAGSALVKSKKYVKTGGIQVVDIVHPAAMIRAPQAQGVLMQQRAAVALSEAFEALKEARR